MYFYLSVCLCQPDCTAVNCPQLENCIEEVLESGACCASCLQIGCTCEGYQYYDCINAGFKNGKVQEGDSYFVDYGSTECSCPVGGGRISCNFISCPEMPPNCIEVSEPADGCVQCQQVGCVQDGQQYEAGHSFHVDSCRVCHCPNEGGSLMCYPVPNCDPNKVQKPIFDPAAEADQRGRAAGDQFAQHGNEDDSTPPGKLPLFKVPLTKQEEAEDLNYNPTDFPETYPQSLVFPTQPSSQISTVLHGSDRASSVQHFDRLGKLEQRQQYGVYHHPPDKEEVTESLLKMKPPDNTPVFTTPSWRSSQGARSVPENVNQFNVHKTLDTVTFPFNQGLQSEKTERPQRISESRVHLQGASESQHHNLSDTTTPSSSFSQPSVSHSVRHADIPADQHRQLDRITFPLYIPKSSESPIQSQPSLHDIIIQGTALPEYDERVVEEGKAEEDEATQTFHSVVRPEGGDVIHQSAEDKGDHQEPESSYSEITPEPSTSSPWMSQYLTTPTARFTTAATTSQVLLTTVKDEREPSRMPAEDLLHHHSEKPDGATEGEEGRNDGARLQTPEGGLGVFAGELLQSCCADGQKWAAEKHHCSRMPLQNKHSICSIVQKQCCLSSVKESQCESGMMAARGGAPCQVEEGRQCSDDSYQVCCSCCALGVRVREEGQDCDAHRLLGYPCGLIFLTCCEGKDDPAHIYPKKKQMPRATSVPRQVFDSEFPKEAFSMGATEEAANTVEQQEAVAACQLCQHTCTNSVGSHRCGCHSGYTLQQDGRSCASVNPDEDNQVKEDGAVVLPTRAVDASINVTHQTPAGAADLHPCKDNGPCSQRCTVARGQARCSCFPGFSLRTDGHTCEDVDECAGSRRSCHPSQRCVNTAGSFFCELQAPCPAGYQLRSRVCEDVDECALQSHNCGAGFVCENKVGSFVCNAKPKCIAGFSPDAHGNCVDINECHSLSEPCSSGFSCVNTVGSYSCQKKVIKCSPGYQASAQGDKCVDLDECQTGTHRCAVGQICHNLPGSYRCDCQTGYQYDALRKVCTDVNECWRYPGRLCAHTCENTAGSYHCSCTAGFSLALDAKNCEDVNECEKSPCSQECANIFGSYQCYCRQGYYLKEDGHSCEDIDECSQSIGNLCTFQCLNVDGSYKCSCPAHGYVLSANGHTCRDVDECKAGSHNCSLEQTCYNLQGGFRCLSFSCPPNYKRISDTRCERSSCPPNSLDCLNSPLRITYYQLSFQTNTVTPTQIFRIGPSPAYSGDHIFIGIARGNQEGYFSTRKLNSFMGAVYLQRQVRQPKDFLIDVEMKLLRQGTFTTFLTRIYVFITASAV